MTPVEEEDREAIERSRVLATTSDICTGGVPVQVSGSARPDPAKRLAPAGHPPPTLSSPDAPAADPQSVHGRRQTSAGNGDVKSLLNFVNVASSDIKAALDKSAPCKRSVDHRKYLQKQLRRYSGSPPAQSLLADADDPLVYSGDYRELQLNGNFLSAPIDDAHTWNYDGDLPYIRSSSKKVTLSGVNSDSELSDSREDSGLQRDYSPISTADSQEDITPASQKFGRLPTCSSQQQLSMAISGGGMDKDPLFEKISAMSGQGGVIGESGALETPESTAVPLRQRSLPASFWQEPNRPKQNPQEELYAYYNKHGTLPPSHLYKDLWAAGSASAHLGLPLLPITHEVHKLSSLGQEDPYYHSLVSKVPEISGCLYPRHWPYGPGLPSHPAADQKLPAAISHPRHPRVETLGEFNPLYYRSGVHPVPGAGATPHSAPPVLWDSSLHADPLSLHKQQVWRPIPTKTLTLAQRYHPFADVH